MEWIRLIGCFFGFHQYIPLREKWFLYRQKNLYIEDQDYLQHGENITTVIVCPHCKKRLEIEVKQ